MYAQHTAQANVISFLSDEITNYRFYLFFFRLILTLSALAEKLNCYKVTLECKDSLVGFYGACGFKKESDNSNYLQKRLC